MKNILLTLGAMSIGTLVFAQTAAVKPQPVRITPQHMVARVAVPKTPVKPVEPAPTALPDTPEVPEVPEIPEYTAQGNRGAAAAEADFTTINTNITQGNASTTQDNAADEGLTKNFSRTFPAAASDDISINNQFGSITVKTWDRKEVKADVTISAYSNNADEQRKLLDGTRILADKSGDQIAFKTEMSTNRNGNWGNGTRNGKKWRREVRVNYTLYVPATIAMNISQQYGNVEFGSFAGPVIAKVQYGDFNAQKLSNSNNTLNVQYGKMTVQDLNKANLKQQYGGGITLGTARDINVSAQYANVKIDRLLGDATMSVQYNKVNIGLVAESARVLTISAQYAGVDVGFSDSYKGKMDVRTSYGSFKFGAGVSAKMEGDDEDHGSFTKTYTGNIGGGGSGQVRVNSSYGGVTFR